MLNQIKDNDGARKKSKRLGRGIGSGKGKTAARGGKGQTARTGVALNGFEGGQNPLYCRMPKRGFNNYTRVEFEVINLHDVETLVTSHKIADNHISIEILRKYGLLKGKKSLIKLLSRGEVTKKVTLDVHAISQQAAEKISQAGGAVNIIPFCTPDSEAVQAKKANGKKMKRIQAAIAKAQARLA